MTPEEAKILGRWITRGVIGLVVLILLFGSFGVVQKGEIGIKTRLGNVVGVHNSGFYVKLPFFEKMNKLDVQNHIVRNEHFVNEKGEVVSDNALQSSSKDIQEVGVSVVVQYTIDRTKAVEIFTQYDSQEAYEEGAIKPVIKNVVKASSAQYTAEELVTKRAEFTLATGQALRDAIASQMGVLTDVNITNIEFSKSYTDAIEKKVVAEQDALASKNKLEQTKYEGEQKIVSAKAEAEAIRIQSQAINSQGGEDYVNLKAIEKWNGVLPTQFVPGSAVPFLNLR